MDVMEGVSLHLWSTCDFVSTGFTILRRTYHSRSWFLFEYLLHKMQVGRNKYINSKETLCPDHLVHSLSSSLFEDLYYIVFPPQHNRKCGTYDIIYVAWHKKELNALATRWLIIHIFYSM